MKLIRRLVIFTASITLMACSTFTSSTSIATSTKQSTPISSTASAIPSSTPTATSTASQNSISPTLIAGWDGFGQVYNMVWSPDSKMFVVKYSKDIGKNYIQAFDVKSLNKTWIAQNESTDSGEAVFSPNSQLIVEPDEFDNILKVRSAELGNVIRELQTDCLVGSQILYEPGGNTFLIAENAIEGLNASDD